MCTPILISKRPSSAHWQKPDDVQLLRNHRRRVRRDLPHGQECIGASFALTRTPIAVERDALYINAVRRRIMLKLATALMAVLLPELAGAQTDPAHRTAPPAGGARLTYTRTLPGSVPEYLALVVNSDGSGSYEGRRLSDPSQPRGLKLSPATTQKIFALTAQLNNLRDTDLNSRKKVANLGLKALTYENGAEKNRVEFNFTQQKQARDLVDLFEKVATAEEAVDSLQYAIKYDPLGLPQELLNIQIAISHDDLAEPELMVPWLEQISGNPRFMHVAQLRAQDILKSVNGEK